MVPYFYLWSGRSRGCKSPVLLLLTRAFTVPIRRERSACASGPRQVVSFVCIQGARVLPKRRGVGRTFIARCMKRAFFVRVKRLAGGRATAACAAPKPGGRAFESGQGGGRAWQSFGGVSSMHGSDKRASKSPPPIPCPVLSTEWHFKPVRQ